MNDPTDILTYDRKAVHEAYVFRIETGIVTYEKYDQSKLCPRKFHF